MIKLTLEVDDYGVKLFDYLVASEATTWKLDTFRRSIGEAVIENEAVEIISSDLIGRRGYALLKTEEYNGKINNKVERWLEKPVTTETKPPKKDDDPF